MLKVGIIGAGGFAARHAQAISQLGDVQLTAICRRDPAALAEFGARFPARPYSDYRDLLADANVDAVLVATPHHQHVEPVLAAAQAGKHIMLEKPMATNLADCDRMIEAAAEGGVSLMVAHCFRFVRPYVIAKDLLDGGTVGRPVIGISNMIKDWMYERRRPWHLDRELGGGVMLTAGMHSLDVLMYLVGSRVESVSAVISTAFHQMAGDDAELLQLRFANGVAGTAISAGYRSGAPTLHQVEMICTEGIIRAHPEQGTQVGRAERWQPLPGSTRATWLLDSVAAEWSAFAAALAQGHEPPVPGSTARHVMATIFAAEESSRLHREVAVS
jgi:phthalate 4,5-cis-dihydrodiol dehydrogenase